MQAGRVSGARNPERVCIGMRVLDACLNGGADAD